MLLVLTVVISVSAISASEVNVTDSNTMSLVDDTSDVSVPNEDSVDSSKVSLSSEEVLESENSNTLSTNSESDSLSSSSDEVSLSASEKEVYSASSSTIDVSKTITSKDVLSFVIKMFSGRIPNITGLLLFAFNAFCSFSVNV